MMRRMGQATSSRSLIHFSQIVGTLIFKFIGLRVVDKGNTP